MSRGPASFKRRDVTSAVLALRAAGCEISGVEWDPVTHKVRVLVVTRNDKNSPTNQEVEVDENEWDAWVAEKHNKPPAK